MKWIMNALASEVVVGPVRKNFKSDQGYEEERERSADRMKARFIGIAKAIQDGETVEGLREQGFVGVYELEEEDVVLNGPEMELLLEAKKAEAYDSLRTRLGTTFSPQTAWAIINTVGQRIGVRKMLPCGHCDGNGSVPKWEALKPSIGD